MQFYLITHDGGTEWAATQGDAKNRAKELGGTWEGKDVPTDKPNLLIFLNENCRDGVHHSQEPTGEYDEFITPSEEPAPPPPKPKNDHAVCPRCNFDRKTSERVAARWAQQATIDARLEWISEEADMHVVGKMAEAVAGRYKQLAKEAS